jgi:hypothetical protein
MNSILFSNQKPTNRKKWKSHKMFDFAQDIGIRNWMKILLVSTTLRFLPPFPTAKKTWNKVLAILFFKCTPKLNAYPWKKKNAQIQSLFLQIWRLEIWSRKCFRLHPRSTPHLHFQPPRKNVSA